MVNSFGYTNRDDFTVGAGVAEVKFHSYGGGANIRKGGKVAKVLPTRVVIEWPRADGTTVKDRWVVTRYPGDVRGREGVVNYYSEPRLVLVTDEYLARAEARRNKVVVENRLQQAASLVGASRANLTLVNLAELETALAAYKEWLAGGEDE